MSSSISSKKNEGADAWKASNWPRAIMLWTEAIELCQSEKNDSNNETLKTLYSNRSAAFMKNNNATSALLDADSAIKLDSRFGKGYTRKGDALYSLARYTEAESAYLEGSTKSNGDAAAELKKKATKAKLSQQTRTSSSSSSFSGSAHASSGSGVKYKAIVGLQFLLRTFLLLNSFFVFLPFGPLAYYSRGAYFRIGAVGATSMLTSLLNLHGRPRFDNTYAQRLFLDPTFWYLFMSVILMGTYTRQYIFAAAPVILTETALLVQSVSGLLASRLPAVQSRIGTVSDNIVVRFAPSGTSTNWLALPSQTKWDNFFYKVQAMAGHAEVYQGLYLIYELILPQRNFLMVFMWAQYMQLRYMTDQAGHVKRAVGQIDTRVMSLLSHSMCPTMLLTGYTMLRTYCAKRADPQSANADSQAGGGGLAGMVKQCTVS
jgi:tetratricopeptide (TPR) repeat protein